MSVDKNHEEIELNPNTELGDSVAYGVSKDQLNVKSLALWSVAVIVFFVVVIIGVFNMYKYNRYKMSTKVSAQSVYFDKLKSKTEAAKTLNTFGIIDADKGVYRIPIDSAMTIIANEYKK